MIVINGQDCFRTVTSTNDKCRCYYEAYQQLIKTSTWYQISLKIIINVFDSKLVFRQHNEPSTKVQSRAVDYELSAAQVHIFVATLTPVARRNLSG